MAQGPPGVTLAQGPPGVTLARGPPGVTKIIRQYIFASDFGVVRTPLIAQVTRNTSEDSHAHAAKLAEGPCGGTHAAAIVRRPGKHPDNASCQLQRHHNSWSTNDLKRKRCKCGHCMRARSLRIGASARGHRLQSSETRVLLHTAHLAVRRIRMRGRLSAIVLATPLLDYTIARDTIARRCRDS